MFSSIYNHSIVSCREEVPGDVEEDDPMTLVFQSQLKDFLSEEDNLELVYPSSLSRKERRIIHEV